MATPGQESRFWLSLTHSGQRIREELNEELPDTSIPLSKCVIGGFEGDAFNLIVSKDAYPNGVHIYTRKKANRTDRFLEGIRDDVWNFYKDDPTLAGRLDPCWRFHLQEWEFGKTDLVWILVVGLTDTGAYDGRGHTKGFLVRSQPRNWQVANSDAYLHEVLASLKIDSTDERQDSGLDVEPASAPRQSSVPGQDVPSLSVTAPSVSTAPSPITSAPPGITQSSATTSFDPLAAARRAPAFTAPRHDSSPSSAASALTSTVKSSTPRRSISAASLARGVKRNQHGGQRTSPTVGSMGSTGRERAGPLPSTQPQERVSSIGQEEHSGTGTRSVRRVVNPQRRQQDQIVQPLPRVQSSEQPKGNDRGEVPSPRRAPPERRQATSPAGQSSPRPPTAPPQDQPSAPAPISDRRREKSRAIDPPPRPVPSKAQARRVPIIEIIDDSDSSLDAAAYFPFSNSEDSDDDVPLDAAYKCAQDVAMDRAFAESFEQSLLLRRSPRLRQKSRSRSRSLEAPAAYDFVLRRYEPNARAEVLDAFHRIKTKTYLANPQLSLDLRVGRPRPRSNNNATPAAASSPASSPASTDESQKLDLRIDVEDAIIPDWIKKVVGGGSPVGPLTVLPLEHRPDPGEPEEVAQPPRKKKDRPPPGLLFDISFKDKRMQERWTRCLAWRSSKETDAEKERQRLEKEHLRYLHR
ncbi:hypothetical protein PSEUBRA_003470 [Kalmanozyma brasiliensis GHG001]|uniref:uncharacterized protein n=1 Tax=Kalmanozyma brasiliensis (strain GHG001) TaxID=1365824 RepID=UPI002867BDB3|nr:uncharacterized protein PSEUBRA_003470 [Kalmanozyma brasiliensis GHG001]KAF6767245.1 hypothetical protein PSEUBRA_003470 [Kalmanozyma brasiliensis GHG001]